VHHLRPSDAALVGDVIIGLQGQRKFEFIPPLRSSIE
jgi:hypothetical protein